MKTSREVPVRDLSESESYTGDEIKFLKERWSESDVNAVSEWVEGGALESQCPAFVLTICSSEKRMQVPDLRGIRLTVTKPRNENDPLIDLRFHHLDHADFSQAHLERADLRWAHLEHAMLTRAQLEHADLTCAHLEHADLMYAHLEHAALFGAHLEHAHLFGAHLEHADLSEAHLEHADLEEADIRSTDLSEVHLDETVFRNVAWKPRVSASPNPNCFVDFDVRGIRYSNPLFDQFVRQSEFIRRCRETWPKPLFLAWELTCNCGRSLWRWLFSCAVVTFLFALGYLWSWGLGLPLLKVDVPGGEGSLLAYLYFSVVTFSTLGFGDVTPVHWLGEMLVILEVLLGYVFLGGLISIFTMKLVPPR